MGILPFFLLIIKCCLTLADPSVSLTVEGGDSLVGEHCPGTVRLFCEGVELNSLRWRYNGTVTLHTFLSDGGPSIILLNDPTFRFVQLTAISMLSSGIASFSSVLSVDLENLHRNAISNISCGDVITIETVPIDLIIKYETALSNPKVSFISVYYNSGILQSVQVSWIKLQPTCPSHTLDSISYTVDLEGFQPIRVDYNACREELCEANVNNMLSLGSVTNREYQLTLSVTDTMYPISGLNFNVTIRHVFNSSNDYLSVKHNFDDNCQTRGVCISPLNTSTGLFCSITYRNSDHQILCDLNVSIGEQFTINVLNVDYYEAVIGLTHSEINEVHLKTNYTVGPSSPEIVKIVLFFSGRGELRNIQANWANIATCNHELIQYALHIRVSTRILSSNSIRSDECMPTLCTLTTLITSEYLSESLKVIVVATNNGGTNTREYSTPIHQSSTQYYQPSIQTLNCTALQIHCFSQIEAPSDSKCVCEYYGGDYLYQELLSSQDLHSNSVLKLSQGIPIHYYILKWNISETLELQEEFFHHNPNPCPQVSVPNYSVSLTTGPDTSHQSNTTLNKTLIIAVSCGGATLLCLGCTLFLVTSIACVTKCKKRKQKERNTVSISDNVTTERENKSRSPTPEYEEIHMVQFNDIRVNANKAYWQFYRETDKPVYQNIHY